MTIEEAIKHGKEQLEIFGGAHREFIEMAIKALEQESTIRNCFGCKYSKDNHNAGTEECHLCMWKNQYTPTTKNDLGVDAISRADAIQAMQNKAKKLTNEDTINGLCGAVAILFDMPSVTPQEPRKGHWIPTYGNVKCSVCGSVKDSREVGRATHYCDFCGAKMVEPQESEG